MVYLVTGQSQLFESDNYQILSIEESLQLLNSCKALQYDSETSCIDAHLGKILCIQFGSKEKDFQIVVDTTTIDILKYKEILENKPLIGHNLKFDLQWLYNHEIIPRKVYDTMIVEQLLYLGYPAGIISYSLASVANRRLGINIDKSIRGQIIWRGLDESVIIYSANDVKWLEDIMYSQIEDCKKKECLRAAELECNFVPVIAYLEWCGIKLDENKWKAKMAKDESNLRQAKEALDKWLVDICLSEPMIIREDYSIIDIGFVSYDDESYNKYRIDKEKLEKSGYILIKENPPSGNLGGWSFTYKSPYKISTLVDLKDKFITVNLQGDLFNGFDITPKANINWSSSKQVIQVAKALGFNTTVQDKKTKEDKDSVLEKHLKGQKGINDEFLNLYFDYQEHAKVVSSFGQSQLNMINPKTGRCHTIYRQLGAASGRMS